MGTPTTGEAHVDAASFLSIPASRGWSGTIVLSSSISQAIGASAVSLYPAVTVESTDPTSFPAPGSIVAEVALSAPGVNLLALLGEVTTTTGTFDVTVLANTSPVSLKLHFNGSTSSDAVATGTLL